MNSKNKKVSPRQLYIKVAGLGIMFSSASFFIGALLLARATPMMGLACVLLIFLGLLMAGAFQKLLDYMVGV